MFVSLGGRWEKEVFNGSTLLVIMFLSIDYSQRSRYSDTVARLFTAAMQTVYLLILPGVSLSLLEHVCKSKERRSYKVASREQRVQ